MKIAEIRELSTKELLERVDAEVAAYDQKKINHSISPMDNPSQIKTATQIDCAHENRIAPERT